MANEHTPQIIGADGGETGLPSGCYIPTWVIIIIIVACGALGLLSGNDDNKYDAPPACSKAWFSNTWTCK